MTTYLIRRLLLLIPTLIGITLLTFLLVRLAPGNAALLKGGGGDAGRSLTAEQRDIMIKSYGLDKPILVGYADWSAKLLHGDFGDSFVDHRPVLDKIWERLGLTVSIAG